MTDDLTALRESMVAHVRARGGAVGEPIAAALRVVPRHAFLPGLPVEAAYRDEAIVTKRDACGRPISSSSQPTIMALMLDQLGLEPGHRVLEIGAGTGYNAALITHLVGEAGSVVSVDIDPDVVDQAAENLAGAGYSRVRVVCADGVDGFPAQAPYDRVIVTVGAWDLAPAWLDQLTPDGRLVAPLDLRGVHRSVALERTGDHWTSRSVLPCGFMGMRGALAAPERDRPVDGELSITVPNGQEIDAAGLSAALSRPAAERATGVPASPADVFDGMSLWLAVHEPHWCFVSETAETAPARLGWTPLHARDRNVTGGIVDGDSLAVVTRRSNAERSAEIAVLGYGPHGDDLAGQLVAHLRTWHAAGRPGSSGLRIHAYPRSAAGEPSCGAVVIDKRHTRLVLSWPAATTR